MSGPFCDEVCTGSPSPAPEGEHCTGSQTPDRAKRTAETRGKHYTSSSEKTFEAPGDHVAGQGEVTCTLADTAYQLTLTPTPCIAVQLWNKDGGLGKWGNDTITTDGGYVPKVVEGILWVPIKDASLIYVASGTALDKIGWAAVGREDQN